MELPRRGLVRPVRHVGARRDDQGPRRRRHRAHARRGRPRARAGARRGSPHRRAAGGALGCRARPARHHPPRRGAPAGRHRPVGRGRARRPAAARPRHALGRAVPARRARAGTLRSLVRDLPAQRGRDVRRGGAPLDDGHPAHGGAAAARHRRHGVRRRLPHARAPHRAGRQEGPEQHPRLPARGPRQPLRDRLPRRRARRHPPRPRHLRGLRRLRRGVPAARPRGRHGPRAPVLPRPPVGDDPPRVVHHPRRRHHRLRREPAEEVPGHLPAELRQRPRGDLRRGPPGRAGVDRPRGHPVPRRQPPHQAGGVLAVAHRRRGEGPSRRHLARRGLHQAGDDAHPGQGRLPAELHLLHLAQRRRRAARVRHRAVRGRGGLHAPLLLADDPRHPHAVHAVRGPGRLEGALGPRRHARSDVRHLRRLRAHGARGPPGRRGADRQREVPVQGPPLGRLRTGRRLRRAARSPAGSR